jgi:undecaprenyl-diphosphatase
VQVPPEFSRPIAAAAIASVSAVLSFVAFASEVFEREMVSVDAAGRAWVTAHRSPVADALFTAVTTLAATKVALSVSLIAALVLWWRGVRRAATPVALAAVLAPLASQTVKPLYGRLRPGYLDAAGRSFSFPSGHATVATAVALTIAYVMVREGVAPRLAPAIALLFVAAVGASRVYLQEHWVTDVVGGLTMGIAIAAACAAVYELMRARSSPFRDQLEQPAVRTVAK